jgi:hypothetical protein
MMLKIGKLFLKNGAGLLLSDIFSESEFFLKAFFDLGQFQSSICNNTLFGEKLCK